MAKILRKNINLNKEDYDLISINAKKRHMSISKFLSTSAIQRIKQDEQMDLFEFLDKYCENVSKEEQNDIENLLKDYDENDDSFEEITINDVLNNKV